MSLAVLGLALAALNQAPELPEPSSLASVEFKQALGQVRKELAASRFAQAKELLAVLPRRQMSVRWDDSAVPAGLKSVYAAARDDAFAAWKSGPLGIVPSLAAGAPDIKISFAPSLPAPADGGIRQAAVFFRSYSPSEPRVEAVIALRRGAEQTEAGRRDIASEVSFAVGAFLGLARLPREGGAMGRVDTHNRLPTQVLTEETLAVRANLEAVEALKRLADAGAALPARELPSAFVDARILNAGEALQGGPMTMSFEVVNRGRAPLQVNIVPDCSCFSLRYVRTIAEGASSLVQVAVNTRDYPGPMNKAIYVYTNDPEWEPLRISVIGRVNPAYRFIWPTPSEILLVEDKPIQAKLYLLHPPENEWLITQASLGGVKGSVAWKPWEGFLADPEFDDPARSRAGFELTLVIQPPREPGRLFANVSVKSTSQEWPLMERGFLVQRGIVSLPGSVFFGEIPAKPASGWVTLTRPGMPFRITKITSNSSAVSAKHRAMPNGDVRLDVSFNGKAVPGRFSAILSAHTSDPKQPIVTVPVQATIR